ncbi:MAG: response regulator [bacterium]|nr:response regulator [bacterium]MDI1337986.1 response regulator [Lacunisphaera sp.]
MNPPDTPATVLLVDDDKNLLAIFSEALSPDFTSDTASSVKDAEALMNARKYKVVVSDHNMPGGNGLNFLARVRKQHPETIRLLLTSYLDPKLMAGLSEAEPYRYLLKPISIPDLLKAVRDASKHHDQGKPAA